MKKTILITGTSSGIGKATAIYFAEKGWNVIATMRDTSKGTIFADYPEICVSELDVTNLQTIDKTVQDSIERFGKIDVLVNNAGYGAAGILESINRDSIVNVFNTNVIGLLDVTRALIPHFRENKNGTIVNLSSTAGKVCTPFGALYNGTKFAVEGLSEAMALELGALGIKVRVIQPGTIATDFHGRSFDHHLETDVEEYKKMLEKVHEWQKNRTANKDDIAQPEEVAATIFEAVTTSSDKFRYTAGRNADKTLAFRNTMSDEEYIKMFTK